MSGPARSGGGVSKAALDLVESEALVLPWVTGTAYKAGIERSNGGTNYLAVDNHTAGATFAGDLAAHWTARASLPAGGTIGQTLRKLSSTNGDAAWQDEVVTKRISRPLTSTCQATTGAGSFVDFCQRVQDILPVTPTRYRFRFANYNVNSDSAGMTGLVTCKGVGVGKPAAASGRPTGIFGSAPTQKIAADVVTFSPGTTDGITAWIDNSDKHIRAGEPYLASFGFTVAAGGIIGYDSIQGLYWNGAGAAASFLNTGAPTGSGGSLALQDIRMELEYVDALGRPVVLVIDDSIGQGADGGDGGTWPHESWPGAAALGSGVPFVNLGVPGSLISQWADTTKRRWARADLATTIPDILIVGAMSNDIAGAETAANVQGFVVAAIAAGRSLGIREVWIRTCIPRNFTGGIETVRTTVNNWARGLPANVAGVIDCDKALRIASAPSTADADYISTYPHPLRGGYQRMASVAPPFGVRT